MIVHKYRCTRCTGETEIGDGNKERGEKERDRKENEKRRERERVRENIR